MGIMRTCKFNGNAGIAENYLIFFSISFDGSMKKNIMANVIYCHARTPPNESEQE